MNDSTPVSALIGGALVGLSATLFLLTHGRVAGISGLYGGLLRPETSARGIRAWFVAGLVAAGVAMRFVYPGAFATTWSASLPVVVIAGVLVGYGTQLGGGCTSGHGVCGISRWSRRSLVATAIFMSVAALTVLVVRHVFGGGQ
jgi:uncharacterized membrane protein YedE/YeeE